VGQAGEERVQEGMHVGAALSNTSEPPQAWVLVSGWTEGDAFTASPGAAKMGQDVAPVRSASAITGKAVAGEEPCPFELVVLGTGVGSSQALSLTVVGPGWGGPRAELADPRNPVGAPFVLDDPTEEREWSNFHSLVGGMAHAMSVALAELHKGADPCRVSILYYCLLVLMCIFASCFVTCSLLQLMMKRS
jgi:hypothetical protein